MIPGPATQNGAGLLGLRTPVCSGLVGTLVSQATKHRSPLPGHMLVGRSPACGLQLSDPTVSTDHASLSWNGDAWEVRDLGSKNGTFLDGVRLRPGTASICRKGQVLAFGDLEQAFELVDDGPPAAVAIEIETGAVQVAQNGMISLPHPDDPQVSIYEGVTQDWMLETGEGLVHTIEHGETVRINGKAYRIQLPVVPEGTPLAKGDLSLNTVTLEFQVSSDEEHVDVVLLDRGLEQRLERREHNYVLLTLARLREADEELPIAERGWRDRTELERLLKMDSNALNVSIHRARQQLSAAGVQGAAGIVQVKRKERRFGTPRFRIIRQSSQ